MPFVAHAFITAGLLALPGLVSLAADKASIPLESMISSLRSQWEKKTDSTERRVVIDLYDRVMKSNQPLQETLREFDPDGDGMISCWECKQALRRLELPENQCETLMGLMKRRFGNTTTVAIESWLDYFQELYLNARQGELGPSEKKQRSRLRQLGEELPSKKTFVEIFNDLDKNNDGFISEEDFSALLDSNLKTPLTKQERHELFGNADRQGNGLLNLFEFMSMMRKIVRVGIQEIGYGYLPLAWASLTAYWLGVGMKELGLSLARLPDTFFMDSSMTLPHISASTEVVQATQAILVVGALPISIGLTQKLCDDNKIGGLRFGLHAVIQLALAAETLHLVLASSSLTA
jgi:Ca2+-binding EF-hand superfamily protein